MNKLTNLTLSLFMKWNESKWFLWYMRIYTFLLFIAISTFNYGVTIVMILALYLTVIPFVFCVYVVVLIPIAIYHHFYCEKHNLEILTDDGYFTKLKENK